MSNDKLVISALAFGITDITPTEMLPDADCQNCEYLWLPKGDGHCYMFSNAPGPKCGQFKKRHRRSAP